MICMTFVVLVSNLSDISINHGLSGFLYALTETLPNVAASVHGIETNDIIESIHNILLVRKASL